MRLHRFFVEGSLSKEGHASFDKELYNQLHNVFRLQKGDGVVLCDGKKNEASATIELLSKNEIKFKIEKIEKNLVEPKRNVILYCALLKRENFELIVQKATEIGVSCIVPLITKRTVKTSFRKERIEKIIKEAAEQSGRGIIPEIKSPLTFTGAIKEAKENSGNFFFDTSGEALKKVFGDKDKIGIWIGPEGGWDDMEIMLAKENKFDIISLGALTLRAETAAIVASYTVLYL